MSAPNRTPVQQLDSRRIQIGDHSVMTTFPIDHLEMVGDRLVLAVELHGDDWIYQGFVLDPSSEANRRRPYAFGAQVFRGTKISLPRDDNRGLVLPSGAQARLPGAVLSAAEMPDGFLVLVDALDVGIENVFFVERDGRIRWQVKPNPFARRTAGGYNAAFRTPQGEAQLEIDRAGYFAVDVADGSLTRHVPYGR
jgi:hypothetical protein